jgi:Family of unknown function (DUF5994)
MPITALSHHRSASNKGLVHGTHGRTVWFLCEPNYFGHLSGRDSNTMSALDRRRLASPTRLTLASVLGHDDLDGAWWPHTTSIARELPELINALDDRLGQIIDIGVNWSAFDGALDLDSLTRHGVDLIPGSKVRHQRVMTVTGSDARANLLVVPSRTTTALAVMVLRQAADLPILSSHLGTPAYRAADHIVRAARAECAQRGEARKELDPTLG